MRDINPSLRCWLFATETKKNRRKKDKRLLVGGNSRAEQSEVWDIVGKVGKLGKVTIGVGQALEFRL